jgi:hypothetical protein
MVCLYLCMEFSAYPLLPVLREISNDHFPRKNDHG